MTIGTVKKQYYHHNLFSFRRSVQDYKIQMDMEIVTFKYSECVCVIAQVIQHAKCVFSTQQYVSHVWSISPHYLKNGTMFGWGGGGE